jgi:anti-sigma B factor antagonist
MTAGRDLGRRLWRLHTKTLIEGGIPVLFVKGRLDHAASGELETAVTQYAKRPDAALVIDLSGVDYLSSAALKVFASMADRHSRGGGLKFRAPSTAARLALELSGMDALIE